MIMVGIGTIGRVLNYFLNYFEPFSRQNVLFQNPTSVISSIFLVAKLVCPDKGYHFHNRYHCSHIPSVRMLSFNPFGQHGTLTCSTFQKLCVSDFRRYTTIFLYQFSFVVMPASLLR